MNYNLMQMEEGVSLEERSLKKRSLKVVSLELISLEVRGLERILLSLSKG
jgi:hypothetical protein